jgi:methylaspartate mutase epsilon subunit
MSVRPLSQERIPDDAFAAMRRENLARWPTGKDVDLDEAAALHRSLPQHKQLAWVLRRAVEEGRCLTQPRGGFGTFALQLELMRRSTRKGLADVVPTTTDSYTRNEHFALAQRGVEESEREGPLDAERLSAGELRRGGQPAPDRGHRQAGDHAHRNRDAPAHRRNRIRLRLFGLLGSGIAYTSSYIKEMTIEDGIRNYQYLDRLVAEYQARGVELHRRQPGFLTGTNIPPCIAIMTCVLDALLAAAQGRAQLRARARPDVAHGPGRRGDLRLPRARAGVPRARRLSRRFHVRDLRCTGWARGRTTTRSRRHSWSMAERSPRSAARSA